MKSGVDYWKDGLEIVKKDAVTWIIGTFVAMILNILPGVGLVSLFHMAQKAKKGEKLAIGDAMFGLSKLVPSLIAGIIFMIPFMLCTLPGLYFGPQMIYAFSLLASGKETDGVAAIKKSMAMVRETGGFGGHIVRWLILMFLGGIGSIACYIGMYFTFPCAIIGLDNIADEMEGSGGE